MASSINSYPMTTTGTVTPSGHTVAGAAPGNHSHQISIPYGVDSYGNTVPISNWNAPIVPTPAYTISGKYSSAHLCRMIATRMHLNDGEMLPFDGLYAHKLSEDKVVVFVVVKDKYVTIEDELPMFPSDKLMSALRLLQK